MVGGAVWRCPDGHPHGFGVLRVTFPGDCGADLSCIKGTCMQIRCKVYGLPTALSGHECTLERDLLTEGACFYYHDRTYIIVSVVESQGLWFANVLPEHYYRGARQLGGTTRPEDAPELLATSKATLQRLADAEQQLQALSEERLQCGARLDHLMALVELITKAPETPRSERQRPMPKRRGETHVR